MTVVGGSGLLAGAELAGAELAGAELAGALLPWLDCGIGTGVAFSVLRLLGITGLTGELDGGTTTVRVLVAGADVVLFGSFARLASEINFVAIEAFSRRTASRAVRSPRNTPCLNLVGE